MISFADHLTIASLITLHEFQNRFFSQHPVKPPFEEFCRAQNSVIRRIVELEMSELGRLNRKLRGLEPLTMDTVILEEPDEPDGIEEVD